MGAGTLRAERNVLKSLIVAYNALGVGADFAAPNAVIEEKLVIVRELASKATLLANEAYLTDGSVKPFAQFIP